MNDVVVETLWLRQLAIDWQQINEVYFKGGLRRPTLQLMDGDSKFGTWQRDTRTLSISSELCRRHGWGVVLEVLKHEMAHQFVHEVLGVLDEAAHGPAFQQVCARHGIDGAAAGLPQEAGQHERLLTKVAKLLALAESDNTHEAHAAMAAAQRLMLEHNIDQRDAQRRYGFRHLGGIRGRTFEPENRLASLLGEHFFVDVMWVPSFDATTGKAGRTLEVCGTPENLSMAEYVHGFISQQLESLWRAHKKKNNIKSNAERMAYQAGVVMGFAETLEQKRKVNKEQGLVWLGDGDLDRYMKKRHPYSRAKHTQGARGSSRGDGISAGRNIVLHKPVHERGSGGGLLRGRA